MKISCTNTMVPGKTLTEKANRLYDCGFDGISIFEEIESWTEEKEEELLQLDKNTGIHVCEFCFSGEYYGKLMSKDPVVASLSRKIYERAISIGNKLGSVSEMEYQYSAQDPLPLLNPYQKMSESEIVRFRDIYVSLVKQVQEPSCILLEPINRYESPYLNTLGDNAEIVEMVNLPGTGLLFDTFHVAMEEMDICDAFRRYHKLIRHVHLGDHNRLLPGKGNLPWPRFISILEELSYNGFVNLECAVLSDDVLTELKNTVKFLRALSHV